MDSINDANVSEIPKKKLMELLQKHYESLSNRNQDFESQFAESQERNELLLKKIEKSSKNLPTVLTTSVDTMPKHTQTLMETCVNSFENKIEQFKNVKQTIISKCEEEIARCQETFYKMITKDDVALKPYNDVQSATQQLQEIMDHILNMGAEGNQQILDILKKREQDFIQFKKDLAELEPIDKEMRFEIQNVRNKRDQKLQSLHMKSIAEATSEHLESIELLNKISNLKAQLNMQ